jgi:hypothetical protein|tara:strand:- start:1734 stop:2030 length:297 start_codon:yes stop_codon:yes gene_type:complete
MALEQAGSNLGKIISRLKEKYPNHNFDIPPAPDTKCKSSFNCKGINNITYYDQEGNVYCGRRYKLVADESKPWSWEYRECHALLDKKLQGVKTDELPF